MSQSASTTGGVPGRDRSRFVSPRGDFRADSESSPGSCSTALAPDAHLEFVVTKVGAIPRANRP